MKLSAVSVWFLLGVVTPGFAQYGPPPAAPAAQTPIAPPPASVTPKAPASVKAPASTVPAPKKKEEPAPKIEGLTIARPNGTFLGLQVVNSNFVLTFYGKDKKKTAVDVARAALRWPVKYQPNDERAVLNPGGPNTLTSAKVVKPPLSFKVYITLLAEGSDNALENYTVDYRDDAAAAPAKTGP